MSRALLIVDVQNDFTEGGALAVAGGDAVAAGITEFLKCHATDYSVIIASRDWHDADNDNGGHFAEHPDFVDTWPVHCVAGTSGADYDTHFDPAPVTVEVYKGQGEPAYSMFEGVTADGREVAEVLASAGVTAADVVGIATDYCVLASARDALSQRIAVRVFEDLVAGVAPKSSADALDALRAAGATIACSDVAR